MGSNLNINHVCSFFNVLHLKLRVIRPQNDSRISRLQEVTAMVQNALGAVASLGESVKNTFNFSVPFLSWLAVWALVAAAVLLYFVSPRYLVMAWGLNKFTKKLLRPNFVNNNELLDFLSRVPDDEQLHDFR